MGYSSASRKADLKLVNSRALKKSERAWVRLDKDASGSWLNTGMGPALVNEVVFKEIYVRAYLQGVRDSEIKPGFYED